MSLPGNSKNMVREEVSRKLLSSPKLRLDYKYKQDKKNRLEWVDYAKGIGIFLVVIGHVIRGLVNSSIVEESYLIEFVDEWLYAFHMPLFFFISGLFVVRSLSKPLHLFLLDKFCVIAYPYFVWSILQSLLQLFASDHTNQSLSFSQLWQIGYIPIMQFWFLYTLFFILVTYSILYKLKVPPLILLLLSIAVYCLHAMDVSFGPWGILYLARRHSLYFALGALMGFNGVVLKIGKTSVRNLFLIAVGGYLVLTVLIYNQLFHNLVAIPFLAVCGIFASISLAVILANFKLFPYLQNWGKLSLEIFVAHTIAASVIRIVLQKLIGFTEPVIHFLIGSIISIYAPIILSILCKKNNIYYLFTLRSLKN
ncbi:MAG: acyltransferase family protein [Mastigocoleus sp.]